MKPKTAPAPPRDVVTLADLAPQHRVTGGSERRVFGAAKKDLSAGKDVKAGKKAK